MLVLTRQRNEKIIIVVPASDKPTRIAVEVMDIRGCAVRLGAHSPPQVIIDREEISQSRERDPR